MKFNVSAKDLIIFVIFCFFLLFLCSIAVSNAASIINDGVFLGLNPFIGFSSKYIFGTFLLFFSALIAIFASVSSYIFDRDKSGGIGLNIGEKDEKGYARFSKASEIKNAPKMVKVPIHEENSKAAGVVLINDGKNMWVDNGENHTLVIGATGSGKTTCLVDPLVYSLAKAKESMIITDPKGEIYKNHSNLLRARGYKIIVLNFREPQKGNCWNPLTLPYKLYKDGNTDKSTELVDDVALNILQDKKAQDPFWEKSASDYFAGVTLGLFEDAKEEEVNLNSINYVTTVGEEKCPPSNYIKEYFTMKGESSTPYVFASNTINSPTETKGGILSVFRQKIRLFASREQLSEMLSRSDFNMRDIGKQPTAVFMVIHDEKTTYHALATIFIKQCYETLIDVAQECGGKLPVRTNFILDEFANMPPLKDVTTMVTAARSRAIRFTFIIQNFAQLNDVYGKEDAETIRSNCGNLIYLLTTELAALEEISKLCGEKKSKEKDKTASTPLVTVSDLQKMKMNEAIIMRSRLNPFKTKLKPSYEIDWGNNYSKADFISREKGEIGIFDLKTFVNEKKKEKVMESMNNGDNSFNPGGFTPNPNPFFGGMNGFDNNNPFMNNTSNPFAPSDNGIPNPFQNGGGEVDVDELLKKIDAKIAELEEEERLEKEKNNTDVDTLDIDELEDNKTDQEKILEEFKFDLDEELGKSNNGTATLIDSSNDTSKTFNDILIDNSNSELENVNKNIDSTTINNNTTNSSNITDDQYYDDFFQDE